MLGTNGYQIERKARFASSSMWMTGRSRSSSAGLRGVPTSVRGTRFPIARLRYTKARREWQIYWRDQNIKFHAYDLVGPSADVESLLAHIDTDPTGIFWG
ncbi:unannotated protein [freshwater metagenome]|uniref:Unannotated protein n=1 Tax=freshwater metagenome TaxID=449393 RepID=A0A6J6E3L7_9ZZZZ